MDRQGYEGTGAYETGKKPLAQTIKEKIPGTDEHRMREMGVTGTGNVGTGYTGTDTGYTGTGTGTGYTGTGTGYTGTGTDTGYTGVNQQGASVQERVKAAIPGTDEYVATHGVTGAHRTVQQAKEYIPGTEEHRMHEVNKGGLGTAGYTGTGTGTGTGYTGTGVGAGYTDTGVGSTGMGSTGMGTTGGMGTMAATDPAYGTTGTGAGYGAEGEKKGITQKIKEIIPGTREHEAKKMDEGRF